MTEAFDALLDAYERIGSALPIVQAIDNLFHSAPHVQQVLANVFDMLTFHKRAIVFFKQKSKQAHLWYATEELPAYTNRPDSTEADLSINFPLIFRLIRRCLGES
jgi:hypothetical protein